MVYPLATSKLGPINKMVLVCISQLHFTQAMHQSRLDVNKSILRSVLTKCYCISYPQSMMNCLHMSFLRNRTYKETGCLVYPTIAMVQFLENLESPLLCHCLKGLYICHLSSHDCAKVQINTVSFLTCTDIKCKLRVQNMVKLYMKVRIFHALKCSNAYNTEDKSIKQNRKNAKIKAFVKFCGP